MALDPEGNYYADLPDPPLGGIAGNGITHGTGAPTANTPVSNGYINDATGDFYVNTTGLSTGWVLVTGGIGGTAQVIRGAFDNPNGNVTPTNAAAGAVYYKDQSTPIVFWLWSVSGQNWIPAIT
jgi:hypothetical protein